MPRARSPPAQTRGLNVLDGNNWPTTRKWRISISVLLTSVEPGAKEPLLPERRLHSLNLTAWRHGRLK